MTIRLAPPRRLPRDVLFLSATVSLVVCVVWQFSHLLNAVPVLVSVATYPIYESTIPTNPIPNPELALVHVLPDRSQSRNHTIDAIDANDTIDTISGSPLLVHVLPNRSRNHNIDAIDTINGSPPPPLVIFRKPFCFVHVGKTAGGTLTCRLQPRLAKDCPPTTNKEQSNGFNRFIRGILHKNKDRNCATTRLSKPPKNDIGQPRILITTSPEVYLFALRDPLDRLASWFRYEHPRLHHVEEIIGNRPYLYGDCFDTLQDLSREGLKLALEGTTGNLSSTFPEANQTERTCAKRAWNAVTGRVGFNYHNFYNYEYYWNWVTHLMTLHNENKYNNNNTLTIMAIRSEYLKEDWDRLQGLYDDAGGKLPSSTKTNNTESSYFSSHKIHSSTSSGGGGGSNTTASTRKNEDPQVLKYLCLGLCRELHVYQMLLGQAVNLTPQQKQKSLNDLQRKCPHLPTTQSECPEPHPSIQSHRDRVRIQAIPVFNGFKGPWKP